MQHLIAPYRFIFALVILFAITISAFPQEDLSDIDALMAAALEKQEVDWEQHYNYFYREREELSFEGSIEAAPLHGSQREYLWYVRDGYMVRSPVSVDGVMVSEDERERAERRFIERLKQRQKKDAERGVDRRSFFGFDFEPGNYYYAGRRELDGREVLIIEYYPEDAFSNKSGEVSLGNGVNVETNASEEENGTTREDDFERQMNKVMFATMWVDPVEKQIVRMSLDNLGFDFLPARWLVQLDTIEATMTMHQPFTDIWLTKGIDAFAKVKTASGDLSVRFSKTFYEYVEIEATATYRFPPATKRKKR